MIWKNPFLIRQAEKIDTVNNFIQLFSSEALSFINENSFNTIQFVRSSPGAGKTTVFKAMQPGVLESLRSDLDNTKDFFKIATKNKIIESGEVKLLSCILSCAKNYDLIDDIFKNGRKQQIFFALLNVRITVLMLKSIMSVKGLQDVRELEQITFAEIPEECHLISEELLNGYKLYTWVQSEERKICQYLDALSDEPTNFALMYNTLFLVKLFEPYNVLYNSNTFLNHSLIIFDDVQKLTTSQRIQLINTLFTMRLNLGVWIGERLEALSENEIISSDVTIGREYDKPIHLEEYWKSGGGKNFKKVLSNIAERRVKLFSEEIGGFENCLEDNINYNKYKDKLNKTISNVYNNILDDNFFGKKYIKTLKYIDSTSDNLYDKALRMIVLDIRYKRDVARGQIKLFDDDYSIENYEEFYEKKDNVNVALFYLSIRAKLPYYYGADRIKTISSYNIEQYLAFSGSIFEQYIAKFITKSKRSIHLSLKPEEQEKYIKKVAELRFEEIFRKFNYGENIQNLFDNLSIRSLYTRDKGTNPYAGGAATGVAINKSSLDTLKTEEYRKLFKILSDCVSSNYFEKTDILHSGQEWVVFYYNRWLCVYYNLPLVYGGWFRSSIPELNSFLEKQVECV